MKNKYALCAILLALMLSSCIKNQFSLKFSLAPSVNANYRVAYFSTSKKQAWLSESVAAVQNGKADLPCVTRYATIVYVFSYSDTPDIAIFAERGDEITVTGDSSDPLTWSVAGNDINEEWSKWRKENIDDLKSRDPSRINAAVARYVRENTDEPLALFILMTSYDRRADEAGFDKLYNSLDEKVLSDKYLKMFERADIDTFQANNSAKLPSSFKALVTPDSTIDFRLADSRLTLFWFRRADSPSVNADRDSLRNVFRSADKAAARLAIVSFDPDSAAVADSRRFDSIPAAAHIWEPMAEAGSLAKSFAAPRTPYFIVASAAGKTLYRGSDLPKAIDIIRRSK